MTEERRQGQEGQHPRRGRLSGSAPCREELERVAAGPDDSPSAGSASGEEGPMETAEGTTGRACSGVERRSAAGEEVGMGTMGRALCGWSGSGEREALRERANRWRRRRSSRRWWSRYGERDAWCLGTGGHDGTRRARTALAGAESGRDRRRQWRIGQERKGRALHCRREKWAV